ncbi:hypothetical protein [Xenorhabdus budapestensis]|uniref:Uncharacterized protein n=1 Tax=Xenorhabdus budapestensis TaxID=290110 RepID=A0A2D0J0J3_XENBU|nr:hypothetical protein [Xenorhabdus budapestensis]PHM27772.1 hypothetical protein Xbud_02081 [Xenorhabdus budapestensis]
MKELTTIELGQVSGAGSVMKKDDPALKEIGEYAKRIIDYMPYVIRPEWPVIPPYIEPVCDN